MSRCFPYPPPPSYLRDGARGGGPVFESIKIQKEREKAIPEYSKEKTREKERRKSKKENKVGKFHHEKKSPLPKKREEESEKSGLSEEHGQPSSQSFCYVSDGTQNNRKRKGDELASNDGKPRGNIIRIRLPLCKNKEPDVSLRGGQLCITTSGWAETLSQENKVACIPGREHCPSISKTGIVVVEPTSAPCSFDSERKKNSSFLDTETSFEQLLHKNKKKHKKTESSYKVLIGDWVPPPLQVEQDEFDQEWLFGTQKQERDGYKRSNCCRNVSCLENSWPPRAQYLSEADVHALPYTVPF